MPSQPPLPIIFGDDPYATLVAGIRDFAIFHLDLEGRVRSWNEGARLLFGWEKSEIVGESGARLFTPDDRQNGVPTREIETARAAGRAEDVRWHVRKDGSRFWANGVVTALKNEAGELLGFAKIARDDTARKAIEDDLRAVQERFELVARATNDAVWDWNVKSGAFAWNSNIETTFGYDAGENHPMEWWSARNHPADRDRNEAELREVLESGGHFWEGEYQFMRGDGSFAPVFTRCYILRDETGAPLRVLGAMMDLTGRKQLEENQRIFRQLADNSPDFVGMCDLDLKPIYRNAQVARLLGERSGEMARSPHISDFFFPEDRAFIFDEFFPRVIREGQGITEVRLRHLETGAPVWMSYQLFVLRDAGATPPRWRRLAATFRRAKRWKRRCARAKSVIARFLRPSTTGFAFWKFFSIPTTSLSITDFWKSIRLLKARADFKTRWAKPRAN